MKKNLKLWSLGVAAVTFPVAILCIKESTEPQHPRVSEPAPAAATPLSPPKAQAPYEPSTPQTLPPDLTQLKAPNVSGITNTFTPDGKIVQERKALFRHGDGRVEEKTIRIIATPVQKRIQIAPRKQPGIPKPQ